jgi:protein-disulfide isomerase/uncharacterized membrane protein
LSLAGLGLAGYLTFLHLGLLRGELIGGAACGASGLFNCHAVAASGWSSWFGLPVALWGMLGYVAAAALALLAQQSEEWAREAITLLFALALAFVAADILLLAVMLAVVQSLCLFCLLTYGLNVTLLVVAARSLGRPWQEALQQIPAAAATLWPSRQRPAAALFWGVVLVGTFWTVAFHLGTVYASRGTLGNMRQQLRQHIEGKPRIVLDTASDPSHGAAQGWLTVVEFSDFLCPACQRASKMNVALLTNYRDQARLIFKHYPLDAACNPAMKQTLHAGACQVAAASECAHLQGQFWPFHDLVFAKGKDYAVSDLASDARRLGLDVAKFRACLASGEGMLAVKRDIAEGAKIGVTSTPTYVVNGVPVAGGVTPEAFRDLAAVLKELGS